MIVYDGTYRMQPDANQGFKPRTQWTCAWRIRIINLGMAQPDVQHIRPMIVIANQTGLATSLSSCAESIGKKISRDFNLDVSHVLWVEHFPNKSNRWHVATFATKSQFGHHKNYSIRWRPIRPNELNLIRAFIPNIEDPR
ncbi:MAG: hypothetical protein HKO68_08750 [Desulfobacterales bacterium]|nr:hypothetical protein [Deltaproteobacteria bacterium]NNL76409.1 hypothetical protein [Desulfobacterales bacterium]